MKPFDFKWTKFYKNNAEFSYHELLPELSEKELIICSVVIDTANYSVLTTQRLITRENGQESFGYIDEKTINKGSGDFKGYRDKYFTLGRIQLRDETELKFFVETGKASMVMVYGVRTMLQLHMK